MALPAHRGPISFASGFVVGIGNGLILGTLMYRSALVPRHLALLGIVGGSLIVASGAAVLLGVFDKGSAPQGIATAPEFVGSCRWAST